jgi:RNA polymerase sigma-70 factor (ECF subfamily)
MNEKDFVKEISTHKRHLKSYISQKVGEQSEVEEILQETLIAASQSLPTFKEESSFFTWLCGIANHEIADFYRKKKIKTFLFSRFPFLENLVSEALGPEEELLKKELRKEVKKTLSRLTEGYAQVLRLKYYQDLNMEQIAQKLGMTVKAVESRLSRAREAFRKEWATQSLKI